MIIDVVRLAALALVSRCRGFCEGKCAGIQCFSRLLCAKRKTGDGRGGGDSVAWIKEARGDGTHMQTIDANVRIWKEEGRAEGEWNGRGQRPDWRVV